MILTPMKIYYCTYTNFHNDPNPVLFVFHSTSQYTEGLNIRYLSIARRAAFYNMIRRLAAVGTEQELPNDGTAIVPRTFHYDGRMMYSIIKKYYPDFAKVAYRKYFSYYLTGQIVNDTLNASSPLTELMLRTQALVNQATSNIMETRAEEDAVIDEVNTALYNQRVKEMRNYENLQYTLQKVPGPSLMLPDRPGPDDMSPEDLSNRINKKPGQQPGGQGEYGEDITPG